MEMIIQSVHQDKWSHKEAAVKHRVSPRLVQSLTKASKNDPLFLSKARAKETKRKEKLRVVIKA